MLATLCEPCMYCRMLKIAVPFSLRERGESSSMNKSTPVAINKVDCELLRIDIRTRENKFNRRELVRQHKSSVVVRIVHYVVHS